MSSEKSFSSARWGIIVTGLVIGVFAAILQKLGNPPNMGVCVACFERDIAGALGFHRLAVTQYLRPELIGFIIGSMIAALTFREFKPRAGSAPMVRFFLGVFAMIGALVFLGCPWRALLRLAGGDGNAIVGLLGLALGITIGSHFHKKGFSLGRSYPMAKVSGFIFPGFMVILLILLIFKVNFAPAGKTGAIFLSTKGPGSMHAPIWISLMAGLIIGILAQRTRFCTVGAIRDVILLKNFHLFSGIAALVVGALAVNLVMGQFKMGIAAMPIAHSNHLWNFLGMILAGLAFSLAGGCPGRQIFLCGEGDGNAAVFVMGMIVGAGFCHNMFLAAGPDKLNEAGELLVGGPGPYGPVAVVVGLAFCLLLGFTMRPVKES